MDARNESSNISTDDALFQTLADEYNARLWEYDMYMDDRIAKKQAYTLIEINTFANLLDNNHNNIYERVLKFIIGEKVLKNAIQQWRYFEKGTLISVSDISIITPDQNKQNDQLWKERSDLDSIDSFQLNAIAAAR